MNKIILLFTCMVILSSCVTTSVKTVPIERVSLDIQIPQPLNLRTVKWKVHKINGDIYFSLDEKNFKYLSKNTEDVQNRLYLQHSIIKKQKEFYN